MPLSAEDKKEVQDLISAGNTALVGGDAFKKSVTDLVTTAVGDATTTLSKSVETLTATVANIGQGTPAPKADDKNKADPQSDVITAAVTAALKPINDRFAKMDAAEADTTAKATRSALIEKTLKDAKHGGMLATHKTFINSLHAAGVTKPEQITEALNAYKAEMKGAGVEIKETVASPTGEGAKGPTPEDTEAAALERIQANAKNRPGSLAEVGKPKA